MNQDERALFLSLRPEFAEMIVAGTKTVELRRIRPRSKPGTLVIVYASSPIKMAIGACTVKDIGMATPDEIWKMHATSIGIDKATLKSYLRGKPQGVAISVSNPVRFARAIPLSEVRTCLGDSTPPQSYRYIDRADAEILLEAGTRICARAKSMTSS